MTSTMKSLISLICAAGLYGCGSPDDPPAGPSNAASGSACPSGSTLTYEGFAQGFFDDYCTRCHSTTKSGADRQHAPAGYNWDDYDSIAEHAADIDSVAASGPRASNDFMPPSDPRPTQSERRALGEWLACEFGTP